MKNNLFVSQTLKTLTDEFVKIVEINGDNIIVKYKGKNYKRNKSIIGKKLFILDNITDTQEEVVKQICNNCLILKKGDCFGKKVICKDYKHVASVSKEEISNWPEYGDATYYRMKSR